MCGVIVVDAELFRSTWHGRDAYIHNHCLDILITMHFSLICSVVICSPIVIHVILREATSKTYGPRVSFLLYCISFIYIASRLLFCNLYFPIYTTKIPKIFNLLSLSDLTFASDHEGIDNPFIALVARFLIVCSGTRWLVCCLLLDWYLGSHKLREILTLLCCITLSSSRKNQRMLNR
mgnify:CR=1 FL=1